MKRDEAIQAIAFELARAGYPDDNGGPINQKVRDVAEAVATNRGADIAELLDAAERYWRIRENDRTAASVRIADALRQAADFARHKGDDDLASRILKMLFEEP